MATRHVLSFFVFSLCTAKFPRDAALLDELSLQSAPRRPSARRNTGPPERERSACKSDGRRAPRLSPPGSLTHTGEARGAEHALAELGEEMSSQEFPQTRGHRSFEETLVKPE